MPKKKLKTKKILAPLGSWIALPRALPRRDCLENQLETRERRTTNTRRSTVEVYWQHTASTMLRNGWQKTNATITPMQSRQQVIWAHILGPQSSEPITKGFKLNFIRPVGGGKNGFEFGSLRPKPAGSVTAASFGSTFKEMQIFPICSLTPDCVRGGGGAGGAAADAAGGGAAPIGGLHS